MFAWVGQNAEAISALAGIATIIVWLAYFQLMYSQFSRARRPRVYIQQSGGFGVQSSCQLVNMSQQYLDIVCVRLVAEFPKGTFECSLPEYPLRPQGDEASKRLQEAAQVGAVAPGDAARLGTFEALLRFTLGEAPPDLRPTRESPERVPLECIEEFEVRVVAMFGEEDRPIAAYRRFGISRDGGELSIRPATLRSVQLSSRRQRATAERWFEDCLD